LFDLESPEYQFYTWKRDSLLAEGSTPADPQEIQIPVAAIEEPSLNIPDPLENFISSVEIREEPTFPDFGFTSTPDIDFTSIQLDFTEEEWNTINATAAPSPTEPEFIPLAEPEPVGTFTQQPEQKQEQASEPEQSEVAIKDLEGASDLVLPVISEPIPEKIDPSITQLEEIIAPVPSVVSEAIAVESQVTEPILSTPASVAVSGESAKKVIVKCNMNGEVVNLRMTAGISLDEFQAQIASKYRLNSLSDHVVKFKDDSDWVLIESVDDLEMAFELCDKRLEINITPPFASGR
jgi:hypothetical protein